MARELPTALSHPYKVELVGPDVGVPEDDFGVHDVGLVQVVQFRE